MKSTEPRPVATARYVRVSASKARRYVNSIVGKKYDDAMAQLEFMSSPTAKIVRKVLQSAGANAEENCNMVNSSTIVKRGYVNEGPTLKRWLPRAMGRATKILKRTSHITIELGEEEI